MRFGRISAGFLALPFIAALLAVSLRVPLGDLGDALLRSPVLVGDLAATLLRVTLTTLAAWLLGIVAAAAVWRAPGVQNLLAPVVQFMRHVSPFAWFPFAILWFGLGEAPAAFVLFTALFFPAFTAALTAFDSVPRVYREEARTAGAGEGAIAFHVELPLLAGPLVGMLRVLWGLGWTVGVAVEMLGVRSGVGFRLMDSRYLQQHDWMIVILLLMGVTGLLMDALLQAVEKRARDIAAD